MFRTMSQFLRNGALSLDATFFLFYLSMQQFQMVLQMLAWLFRIFQVIFHTVCFLHVAVFVYPPCSGAVGRAVELCMTPFFSRGHIFQSILMPVSSLLSKRHLQHTYVRQQA